MFLFLQIINELIDLIIIKGDKFNSALHCMYSTIMMIGQPE